MNMASVFEAQPGGPETAGWYYWLNMQQPEGPFDTREEAEAACRAAADPEPRVPDPSDDPDCTGMGTAPLPSSTPGRPMAVMTTALHGRGAVLLLALRCRRRRLIGVLRLRSAVKVNTARGESPRAHHRPINKNPVI